MISKSSLSAVYIMTFIARSCWRHDTFTLEVDVHRLDACSKLASLEMIGRGTVLHLSCSL